MHCCAAHDVLPAAAEQTGAEGAAGPVVAPPVARTLGELEELAQARNLTLNPKPKSLP